MPLQEHPFRSGSLALDLLNTRTRSGKRAPDHLHSPEALLSWMGSLGLVDARTLQGRRWSPSVVRVLLTEAQRLRDDVGTLVGAFRAGDRPPAHAIHGVNRVLAASRRSGALQHADDRLRLVEIETSEGPLAALSPIAQAAADLLIAVEPGRVRRCDAEACGRWFVDTSKGGRRRWCSMETCGNRAKATAHRRRRAGA